MVSSLDGFFVKIIGDLTVAVNLSSGLGIRAFFFDLGKAECMQNYADTEAKGNIDRRSFYTFLLFKK